MAARMRHSWQGVLSPWRGQSGTDPVPEAPGLSGGGNSLVLLRLVVCQWQEKTGTVALLGAVSAHWRGADMLAGSLAGWKSWKTAPGALWGQGRGAQPGLGAACRGSGLSPSRPLCVTPCKPDNAGVPTVCSRRKCREKFMFTVSKFPCLVPTGSPERGLVFALRLDLCDAWVAPCFPPSPRFTPAELKFSRGLKFAQSNPR